MTKTPEEMAEEYCQETYGYSAISRQDDFLAGYQAAKDQLADADKVMCSTTMEEIKAIDTGEIIPITNLPTPAKWISVKDRLPEINKGFIGFAENKEVCNCYRYPDHSEDGRPVFYAQTKTGLLICGLESISHWMPLPEAPKEEK